MHNHYFLRVSENSYLTVFGVIAKQNPKCPVSKQLGFLASGLLVRVNKLITRYLGSV